MTLGRRNFFEAIATALTGAAVGTTAAMSHPISLKGVAPKLRPLKATRIVAGSGSIPPATVINNITINAIDAKSFRDYLRTNQGEIAHAIGEALKSKSSV